ncbi:hypothetical protein SAMN04487928_11448 [Butyrivibrio proteoclasticus]|uniref:Uncharacterized protein n=1 Tax=Butyrivibrio proteoclasticus TaxID=43305 RepID=A0A1I5UU82_9FIRM|nr:hypothetical protein [Butyrivibrio proteoclasticus]SFP98748.1 hypothetical protein SAMN04487928_11448 [Butyrivibrio proteoclasticus]
MIGLKKQLLDEMTKLERIKHILDERLQDVPEGRLRISSTGKYTQYYLCTSNNSRNGNYMPKEKQSDIRALAQKAYDKKLKKLIDKRVKQFQQIANDYADDEIDAIYAHLTPRRKELVVPIQATYEQLVKKWKSIPYEGKAFKEGMVEIYTKKGERVRSKSEKILADMFYDRGIEYKYECPLYLKGYGVVYPDFTFLSKKTNEELYWEHEGRMDDPAYVDKAIRKIDVYAKNGILSGERLILTYESSKYSLNLSIVEKLINTYLL